MTRHWLRRTPGLGEEVGAALMALGAAGVTYYLTRLLLSREPLPERSPGRRERDREEASREGGPEGG